MSQNNSPTGQSEERTKTWTTEKMEDTVLAIKAIFLIIDPFLQIGWFIAYIFFDIWMKSLINKFDEQQRDTDKAYAQVIWAFLIISTVGFGIRVLRTLTCSCWVSTEHQKDGASWFVAMFGVFSFGIFLLLLVAGDIVLLVRLWTWFVQFQSANDSKDAAYCAVLGTFWALASFRSLVMACFSLAAGGIGDIGSKFAGARVVGDGVWEGLSARIRSI
jgi:hypothetical protein